MTNIKLTIRPADPKGCGCVLVALFHCREYIDLNNEKIHCSVVFDHETGKHKGEMLCETQDIARIDTKNISNYCGNFLGGWNVLDIDYV